jgi:hypothetical protein
MIEQLTDALEEIDNHLDNIRELIPGMPDNWAKMLLSNIQIAELNLRMTHSMMLTQNGEPEWET